MIKAETGAASRVAQNGKADSQTGKERKKSGMSKETRMILALCMIFVGIVLVAVAFWFSMNWLFYENPRLTIREIELKCDTGFWTGKSEQERELKARDFARRLDIELGKTNLFSVNLKELRERILTDQPEIERVSVWRKLPDLLVFEIHYRVPRAKTGFGYLLDDKGIALRSNYYTPDEYAGLPRVYSKDLRRELTDKGKTTEPEIMDALNFICMVNEGDERISRINIRKVVVIQNSDAKYLQCELSYGENQTLFNVILPTGVSRNQLDKIAERLIPVLDEALKSPSPPKSIDLRFEGSAIVPR